MGGGARAIIGGIPTMILGKVTDGVFVGVAVTKLMRFSGGSGRLIMLGDRRTVFGFLVNTVGEADGMGVNNAVLSAGLLVGVLVPRLVTVSGD